MLLCISADHRATPIPILETLERGASEITSLLDAHEAVRSCVVLVTCNRFEVYAELASGAGAGTATSGEERAAAGVAAGSALLLAVIAHSAGLDLAELRAAVAVHSEEVAAEHLFAVTCGLESAAVGEGEIAGQVRRAHSQAHRRGRVSDLIERLFQQAHRVAREVKHRTGLQEEGRSLVRLALVLAERRIDSWQDARVLLIGTGAYAGATVAALLGRGAENIAVFSPSGRAVDFADARGIGAVPAQGFVAALASADLLIACSSVQDPLLTAKDFVGAETRSRLLLDLGMPRNIDAEVAKVAGVELLDIEAIAKHAPIPELSAAAEARRMVHEAAIEFSADLAERTALPTLVTLRRHVLGILEEELCRARSGDDPAAQSDAALAAAAEAESQAIESALRRFTGRLLHEPSERIRALGRAGRAAEARHAAETLFGLSEA